MTKYEHKLSTYQTHKLIKQAIPDAETVYMRDNRGQMSLEEWLDIKDEEEVDW